MTFLKTQYVSMCSSNSNIYNFSPEISLSGNCPKLSLLKQDNFVSQGPLGHNGNILGWYDESERGRRASGLGIRSLRCWQTSYSAQHNLPKEIITSTGWFRPWSGGHGTHIPPTRPTVSSSPRPSRWRSVLGMCTYVAKNPKKRERWKRQDNSVTTTPGGVLSPLPFSLQLADLPCARQHWMNEWMTQLSVSRAEVWETLSLGRQTGSQKWIQKFVPQLYC